MADVRIQLNLDLLYGSVQERGIGYGEDWRERGAGGDRLGRSQCRVRFGAAPVGGDATGFAATKNAVVDSVDIRFDVAVLPGLAGAAKAALEGHTGWRVAGRGRRGKFQLPEIDIGIGELDAVDISVALLAHPAYQTDFGFRAATDLAQSEPFVGSQFVAREDSGAVAAEDQGAGFFGKNASPSVRAQQEDRNLSGDAPAATCFAHRSADHTGEEVIGRKGGELYGGGGAEAGCV